jgi:hypothetical protein
LEKRILQLKKCRSSTSSGIVSRHGENSVNMTSMTRRKPKTGTRKDGWRNKIKKLGKFMKKRKENV